MSQRFFVIGLGKFGYHLSLALTQSGEDVVAMDRNMERVEHIKDDVSQAICTDASREENLRAVSIETTDTAIVTIGEDDLESSILTTALLAQLQIHRIIARSTNDLHARILQIVGAHEVINPEKELADRIAQRMVQKGIVSLIPLSGEFAISDIVAPPPFLGKTLADLHIRPKYGVSVIAIKHQIRKFVNGEEHAEELITHNPHPDTCIQENDILMCLGTFEEFEAIAQLKE